MSSKTLSRGVGGKKEHFPPILGISEAAGVRSVGVAGILTAFRLSVQSNKNTVGITWTFVFTRNAKA